MLKLAIAAGLGALILAAPGLPAQEEAKLNDANVVAIFMKANQKDVDTGNLAAEKSSNKEVKEMGKMFSDAHKGLKNQAEDLAKKLKVNRCFLRTVRATRARPVVKALGAKSGADFDRDWLAHEDRYHQAVIDAVTKVLLPATTNPELKAFIEKQHRRSRVPGRRAEPAEELGYTT